MHARLSTAGHMYTLYCMYGVNHDGVTVPKELKTLSAFSFLTEHLNKRVDTTLY